MDERDQALAEIKERLRSRKDLIGINYLKEVPSGELDPNKVPAVLIIEGSDSILKSSGRSSSGYPAKRVLEVTFECIVNSKTISARTFCKEIRKAVFYDRYVEGVEDRINTKIVDNVFIAENKTEGPFGYGLPNINGMRLIIDLVYNDNGF